MHLLIDPIGGLSGDMFLGALVDLGLGEEELKAIFKRIPADIDFEVKKAEHGVSISFRGSRFKNVDELFLTVSNSNLESKEKVIEVLSYLVEAEKKVHGSDLHLHELLDIDTLGDICGFMEGVRTMGFRRFYSLPIPLNFGGVVFSEHGPLPNPAPATIEILKGFPIVPLKGQENVTPTGAAIFRILSPSFTLPEVFSLKRIGCGVGTKKFRDRPNVLRLIEIEPKDEIKEEVFVFETNIDDMRPELFPEVFEKLLHAGALDVVLCNAIMKGGRPGYILKAISLPDSADNVLNVFLNETTTLGVRVSREKRVKLSREKAKGKALGQEVSVKVSKKGGKVEFRDIKRLAESKGLPLWVFKEEIDD